MMRIFRRLLEMLWDLVAYTRIVFYSKDVRFVHLIHQEKFTKPYVDFLNAHFDPRAHMVICRRDVSASKFQLPVGSNVFVVNRFFPLLWRQVLSRALGRENITKIIVHSLFYSEITNFFYSEMALLQKKVYWMIWGGDLYNAKRDKMNDVVRAGFAGIITDTDGDEKVYEERYAKPRCVYNAGYTFPITAEMIGNVKQESRDYIRIQINNSCDRSTLEIMKWLSVYKNEPIRVRVIHSYGDMKYAKEVEALGMKLLGDKFEVTRNYMSPGEYAQHMAQNDILILNQDRQQGLGNCFAALALGVKLFIRSEISTFTHLTTKGCVVYDTKSIPRVSFHSLCESSAQERFDNRMAAKPFFSGVYLQALWEKVFVD